MSRKLQRKDFKRRPNISEWNALSIGSEAEMVRVFGSRTAARESYEAWKDRPEFARVSDCRLEAWWVFHGPPDLQRSDDDPTVPDEADLPPGEDPYYWMIQDEDEFEARRALYVIENGLWPGEAEALRDRAEFMMRSSLERSREAWAKVLEALGEGDVT